jgi:hypothetical protein
VAAVPATPEVLTVMLKASWTPDSTVRFAFDKAVRTAGSLKAYKSPGFDAAFVVYFADSGGRYLDSAFMLHPLVIRVETAEANGPLSTTMVKRAQGSASARVNFRSGFAQLVIYPLDRKSPASFVPLSLK